MKLCEEADARFGFRLGGVIHDAQLRFDERADVRRPDGALMISAATLQDGLATKTNLD